MPDFGVSMHPVDLAILAAYFVFVLTLGVMLGRKHEDAGDYFLAGRKMVWPFIGLSLFASNISSTTLIGLAGDAYATGISVFNYEWMAAVVLVFFAIFLLPFVLKSGVFTMPEFLERRFDARARLYFSGLTIFLNIVVDTAGSLFAGALVVKMVFPALPVWQIIAILALVAGIYTMMGGLAAVMYTDAIQAGLLLIGAVVISIVAFDKIGSWEAVTAAVSADKLSLIRPLDDTSLPWLGLATGVPLIGFYFWCTNQFMVQRVLSAKSVQHGQLGSLFAGALKLPVLFIMVLPGTFAILLYPDLERADLVYPTLMFDLLPTGLLGLVIAGFIAALMSQIDSTLNSASTLVTMDFIRRARPEATGQELMKTGRWLTFIFMILSVLWAPQIENFGSLFKYLQKILSYSIPPVVVLFLVGTFWRRANATGAFWTILVGTIAGVGLFIANEVVGATSLHFLYAAPILCALCTVILIVASLMSPAPGTDKLDGLTWTTDVYRAETVALKGTPWYANYRVLSVILLTVTALLVISFA
ncbi:sodium:solute symporter [Kordiimonas lacus]|uniref:Solute:Na+ symporter, SSS family n=1 Tax=Kordiimonas lacus TaxID=637679 RepID=A0A1G6YPU7_9PROT|nr:sodium:solute symporter [Kordiimonas lacus]SDD92053.1 solute:Na+ symporter, SSS family [Kordiimonas lacus]